MPRLAEMQASMSGAMLGADASRLPGSLIGGSDARLRFDTHLRHYQSSLTEALQQKFPATMWLLGNQTVTRAAQAFVLGHPPTSPCIAEYGREFPTFLASLDIPMPCPFIESFARLDWLLGKAAIAIGEEPLAWTAVTAIDPERLIETKLQLQPGIALLRATHAVDELIGFYLEGNAPDRYELVSCETPIQVKGSRGWFSVTRLDVGQFAFRLALSLGVSIGQAADDALAADAEFDPGRGLHQLIDAGLVVSTYT